MSTETGVVKDVVSASVVKRPSESEGMKAGGVFTVVCHDAQGNFKWEDTFHNLVTNQGAAYMNQTFFTGSGYTASGNLFVGLITGPGSGNTYAAGDVINSHAGWTENTAYSGSRKALVMGTATTADPSVINNSSSTAVFTMTSNAQVIAGAFVTTVNTGGTSPSNKLFSEGNFTGGDKIVDSGDTLTVTYEFSLNPA
ncbi:MAG: hypothetical protein EBT86_10495 [Actinobacteria bacterium]|nr:hypothetical protein [Actinomycetota bacterium]